MKLKDIIQPIFDFIEKIIPKDKLLHSYLNIIICGVAYHIFKNIYIAACITLGLDIIKEVYDYFYSHVNYLDNSKIVPETIYKNPLDPEVPNWVTPDKYTPMRGLLDPKYKQDLLEAWDW